MGAAMHPFFARVQYVHAVNIIRVDIPLYAGVTLRRMVQISGVDLGDVQAKYMNEVHHGMVIMLAKKKIVMEAPLDTFEHQIREAKDGKKTFPVLNLKVFLHEKIMDWTGCVRFGFPSHGFPSIMDVSAFVNAHANSGSFVDRVKCALNGAPKHGRAVHAKQRHS